jgi:hypothetical protein
MLRTAMGHEFSRKIYTKLMGKELRKELMVFHLVCLTSLQLLLNARELIMS